MHKYQWVIFQLTGLIATETGKDIQEVDLDDDIIKYIELEPKQFKALIIKAFEVDILDHISLREIVPHIYNEQNK